MKKLALIFSVLLATAAFAQHQYYFSDTLTGPSSAWVQNGDIQFSSYGLASDPDYFGGGSLVRAIPDSIGEVRTTLRLKSSGGTYVTYLRASTDALLFATGSFYAIALVNPTFNQSGCTATLTAYFPFSTVLASTIVPCHDGMTIRAVTNARSEILVFVDDVNYMWLTDGRIASGRPGIGVDRTPDGNTISLVQLDPPDVYPPNAVDPASIRAIAFPNRVDVQWPAATDSGSGVWCYRVYRDGQFLGDSTAPGFVDGTVAANTSYTYAISAIDFHGNFSAATSFSVTTPALPADALDPIRTGVQATGSYWGAAGEQIDTRSGNLNFTLGLLKPVGRGGWGVPFALSYNSQLWRQYGGYTWQLGRDVGYGFGWQLMAGSILPIMGPGGVLDHYVFTASTGAEYRLDVNSGGIWTSREGIYVEYDSNTNRLYFPDGSFWVMGSVSGGTEDDSGTRYPTLMQDTNGNQILIRYQAAIGLTQANTSARISEIEDVRATGSGPYVTYTFTYNNDPIPHLTGITNQIGTSEGYTFSYLTGQPLSSPFDGSSYGTTTFLHQVNNTPLAETRTFDYAASGELVKLNLPRGGWLRWTYRPFAYSGGSTIREVDCRYLAKASGAAETMYPFTHDDAGGQVHFWTTLTDPTGAAKTWTFATTGSYAGLLAQYEDKVSPTGAALRRQEYTWTQDDAGTAYIGAVLTTTDAGQAYQKQSKTEQALDRHGNVLWTKQYGFDSLTTPVRTYTNTYLADGNYTSRHIWNRLLASTVTDGSQNVTLVTNTYDGGTLTARTGMREHDILFGTGSVYRGNVTQAVTPGATRNITYDIGGAIDKVDDGYSHTVKYDPATGTNFAAPGAITPNNDPKLTSTITYNAFLGVTSTNTPGAGSTSESYDGAGRPAVLHNRYGGGVSYTYYADHIFVGMTGGRYEQIYLDGLGRAVKRITNAQSIVESEYDSCACSPMGKLKRVSQPYAPGQTPIWTTYTYDALGRTTRVDLPAGSGTILYGYQGNQTTVTDPAGRWKRYTVDAMGNLVQVTEPAPEGGTHETYYTYNILNQLIQISMPRGGVTQVRSFNYDLTTGRLMSTTNPENGTVSYTYNPDGTLATKTDAKNQRTDYTYDTATQRLTREAVGTGTYRSYTYNDQGLVATVKGAQAGISAIWSMSYTYTPAGQVMMKKLSTDSGDLVGYFGYDPFGRMNMVQYPDYFYDEDDGEGGVVAVSRSGGAYTTYLDRMNRPVRLSGDRPQQLTPMDMVWDVVYGPGDELLEMKYYAGEYGSRTLYRPTYHETRTYNARLQLTRISATGAPDPNDPNYWFSSAPPTVDLEYRYSATANDGRITQRKDWVTGEEVNYGYDSLGRLSSAVTTGPEWGLNFSYDGFGNLTGETPVKGAPPSGSFLYDQTTNRLIGTGFSYDANGNLGGAPGGVVVSYDAWNRVTGAWYGSSGSRFVSGPGNERIVEYTQSQQFYYFYAPNGKLLGKYSGGGAHLYLQESYVYFAGRLIWTDTGFSNSKGAVVDRTGSVVSDGKTRSSYFPYGESSSQNRQFATYPTRDASGLDYAYNRYYSSRFMRFTSPDPYMASGGAADPQSWNRYGYVGNDPVNRNDPSGLQAAGLNPYERCLASGVLTVRGCYELHWMELDGGGGGGGAHGPAPGESDGGGGMVDAPTTNPCGWDSLSGEQQGLLSKGYWETATKEQQQFFMNITADADFLGVNLSDFTVTSIDIRGQNNQSQSRLNLGGATANLGGWLDDTSSGFTSNTQEFLVGRPHDGCIGNYRQNGTTWSMQINVNATGLQIDIDPYNPADGLAGLLGHGIFQVLWNAVARRDTDPFRTRKALSARGVSVGAPCTGN